MKSLEKFTLGTGDRFGRQGRAQLAAFVRAREEGIDACPVWNKSNREHTLIGTEPASVRAEADDAVQALGWDRPYYVDADHIGLATVDRFLAPSDFFTLDVADRIGQPAAPDDVAAFLKRWETYLRPGGVEIPGLAAPLVLDAARMREAAGQFLAAMQEAGKIYRHIRDRKREPFAVEVSVDETDRPQSPADLFLILLMLAQEGVPAQTLAPKFTGRFNKGVDYAGDLAAFEREFDADLAILAFAAKELGFPPTLKLSVHSGSDKFSLYPVIGRLVRRHGAGLHLKTAGTTWLEEAIGLAEAGGSGLAVAREVYGKALPLFDDLVGPYRAVVDIDPARLPSAAALAAWTGEQLAAALRHDTACPAYNPHLRQFFHVSFKVAAKLGPRYLDALGEHAAVVARNVTGNLLDRHLRPLLGA